LIINKPNPGVRCVMKSFKILMLAGAMAATFAVSAKAADVDPGMPVAADPAMMGIYLRADLGWSFLEWAGGNDDNAIAGGAGIGYKFNDNLRADITGELSGDYNVGPGATLNTKTVLGNVYFDWANDSMLTPYVGAGLGYGWVDRAGAGVDDSGFAVGLTAGVSVDLTSNIAVDMGYRFRDIMISGPDTMEHQAMAGLRFTF
jgi:opacity protein-like surface antigen